MTLTATFTIGSGGTVTAVKTGLAAVDRCIADVIEAIELPKLKKTTS